MHPNPAFRQDTAQKHLDFAQQASFGMLCVTAESNQPPLLAHVPFVLAADRTSATLHLARGNAIVRTRAQRLPATIAVRGPHGYVSPDWYEIPDQVPTWNYVAVHLSGMLVQLGQGEIRRVVDEVTGNFEGQIDGKAPWTSEKVSPAAMEKLLVQIVPYRFEIETIEGTWKLNQNKPHSARLGAAAQLSTSLIGQDTAALAALMQAVKDGD